MIQVNATTHTKDSEGNSALTVSTGSLLDVNPHFMTRKVDDEGIIRTKYDIAFDVRIFKNMAAYDADQLLTNSEMFEYNIGYTIEDVDIQVLTSVSDLIGLLATHLENGDASFSGVGVGNTAIVYPTV